MAEHDQLVPQLADLAVSSHPVEIPVWITPEVDEVIKKHSGKPASHWGGLPPANFQTAGFQADLAQARHRALRGARDEEFLEKYLDPTCRHDHMSAYVPWIERYDKTIVPIPATNLDLLIWQTPASSAYRSFHVQLTQRGDTCAVDPAQHGVVIQFRELFPPNWEPVTHAEGGVHAVGGNPCSCRELVR
ncbi:3-hydroxy-3-methylglutaryl coenzyme A synthase [Mycena chlorophos]|uniref:3-hydroxy-3-methylglutaryl coenzyme A synthase n=1 Tax=Mycena chlorophos TaxID=658473 RepID=A0A8H6W795_MYCCL|nr:3-hydroxy-3-methylglutaryl coenzyme A synthase [Mycena chlorophos]